MVLLTTYKTILSDGFSTLYERLDRRADAVRFELRCDDVSGPIGDVHGPS